MILNETYTLANDVTIPKLGLGTWFIDDDEAAQAYGNERGVGEGVRTSGIPREELFVSTKLAAEIKNYGDAATAKAGVELFRRFVQAPYSASVTWSSQVTTWPESSASWMATWAMNRSAAAPCQCSSPGSM